MRSRSDRIVLEAGQLIISKNVILSNRFRLNISIDPGNDSFSYNAPSFPNRTSTKRVRFRDKPTVFSKYSVIYNDIIEGANEFRIAVATTRNMNITDSVVSTGEENTRSARNIEDNFTAGFNIEQNGYFY